MSFFRQIKYEIRNILRSKFLLIIGILILAASVAIPIIGLFTNQNPGFIDGPIKPYATRSAMEMKYYDYPGGYVDPNLESITVKGVVITADNPFYWNIQSLLDEQRSVETDTGRFTEPQSVDLMLEMIDRELDYYILLAQSILTYQDYRMDLSWRGIDYVYDKFFYEKSDAPESALLEVSMYRRGIDPEMFRTKFINITSQERLDAIAKVDDNLAAIVVIVKNDDFPKYIDMRIIQENDQIVSLNENIAIQEQAIIDNPSQEENINAIIEDLRRQIKLIEENNIPLLQYRLEKNIKPGINIWQNMALSDIENSRNQLAYMKILTEKEYNEGYQGEPGIIREEDGGRPSYQEYVANMQKQIDTLNKTIIIAQKSLDTDEPDMKYVPTGPRSRTIQFLDFSMIVALFGVLLGGWLIASEYQQGTIRLLMIRPKTRIKILAAKFVAALLISTFVYLTGSLLNFVTNGICYGFADYAFPNYSVTGATGFIAYYLPKLLICVIPIVFAFTIAFMLSVVVKNIAVSIIVPISLFIASTIIMGIVAYGRPMTWLAYTPIPFIQISSFFQQYSMVQQMMQNGVALSLTYGILLLLGLSAIFTAISVVVFKKRDIVN